MQTTSIAACGLATVLTALALHAYFRLKTTTLGLPCLWTALSAACLAVAAVVAPQIEGISQAAFRFALACTTLCPVVAVLGAKRPQDRGWQWIVLSLWVVLVWPAAQAVMLPTGVELDLFLAWKLFLWGLITLGLLNYLSTSNWRAAILVALGQILLLRDYLGLPAASSPAVSNFVAVLSLLSAAGLICGKSETGTSVDPGDSSLDEQTLRWLSFRNSFGAFWALRILIRVNQTAEQHEWPMRLTWQRFVTADNRQPNRAELAELEQTMDSMLRRFIAVAARGEVPENL